MGVSLTFSEPCAWPCASWTLSYLKTTFAWVLGKPYRISWNQMPSTCQSIPIRVLWKEDDSGTLRGDSPLFIFWRLSPGEPAHRHTLVSLENQAGRVPAGYTAFLGRPPYLIALYGGWQWKNNMPAAKNTGLVIQVARNFGNVGFSSSFISFLFNRPIYKAALLKQKSLTAWKTRLA